MAIIKCKMCGGDLQVIEGSTVCECEYCGTKQTVPTLDNEKKLILFNRASRLLRNCEFDKAYGVFENIVAEFSEEAEAYWGLLLCRYGIEYVDDPATGEKIPTCHRTVLSSIMDDSDFDMACENADGVAKRLYRDEAKYIDRIQQRILKIVESEEPYDVFICYKELDENGERTEDSVLAQEIYDSLTAKGLKTFFARITLENKLGEEYEPYIYAALHSAKVMLVVGTSFEHFDAIWVKNEWLRFLNMMKTDTSKKLIPCFKGIDAYDMPREFKNFLAQDLGKLGWQQDITRGVLKICGKNGTKEAVKNNAADSGITALSAQTEAMLKRGYMMLEDGEYEKADEFFEKVLNNDAECGQAYWGKALAAAKVPNAERYGAEYLFGRIRAKVDNIETVILTIPEETVVSSLRTADETNILEDFSDQELGVLVVDLNYTPVQYETVLQYYRQQENKYVEPTTLRIIADSPDFDRAVKYADDTVHEALCTVFKMFKTQFKPVIEAEENKEINAKSIIDRKQNQIISTLPVLFDETKGVYALFKTKIEEEQTAAQEKAERDYEAALASFESDYQLQVAELDREYEHEITKWHQKKLEYEQGYDLAVEAIEKLNETISQLEAEKNCLSGLFSSRKKKELAEKISFMKKKRDDIRIPEEPGVKPTKSSVINKKAPPRKEDYINSSAGDRKLYLKERIKYSLSPAYKTCQENMTKLKSATVGTEVQFGRYARQPGDATPISWIVLEKENNRLLVISKYALDCQHYHNADSDITWENSILRAWLNNTFMKNAFIAEEQEMIPTVMVKADKNPDYNTDPGNSTQDKSFLLSITEANKYFISDRARQCKPTEYAVFRGWYVNPENGNVFWWLRSPGVKPNFVAKVDDDGSINSFCIPNLSNCAVRPAMWISLPT